MARTLLLNGDYRPKEVISGRDGVILCWQGKANFLEEHTPGVQIRSACDVFEVPAVAVLRKYVHLPFNDPDYDSAHPGLNTAKAIKTRDNYTCVYCGGKGTTIDHVIPRSRGGSDDWSNKVACCFPCNQLKGDQTLEELQWDLGMNIMKPCHDQILRGQISEEVFDRWVRPTLTNRN